jgi:hypothetical protein
MEDIQSPDGRNSNQEWRLNRGQIETGPNQLRDFI